MKQYIGSNLKSEHNATFFHIWAKVQLNQRPQEFDFTVPSIYYYITTKPQF